MGLLDRRFEGLESSYLFSEIASRARRFAKAHPEREIISLGVGDLALPLAPSVCEALVLASREQGEPGGFKGYGPYEGRAFLREALASDYARSGAELSSEEIFINDGAKNALFSLLSLFEPGITVLIPDPVYPAYLDANILAGNRAGFIEGGPENGYLPSPPESAAASLVYLCSPGNPTGAVYDADGLKAWVSWALERDAVIIFDSAYRSFIRECGLPKSIYEIEGAKECAIEIGSFSKSAGFTGLRCGWAVFPMALEREGVSLNKLWRQRIAVSENGAPYVVQRAALASLEEPGASECARAADFYLNSARRIAAALKSAGISCTGGLNSPYVWLECPAGLSSWELFDMLLERAGVVCTPGAGFGRRGEGRCRLSAFAKAEDCERALGRMLEVLNRL
ncbi:MAG: LL-diaminopimelate aminotransferase [Oscillospiraceae bacterium]|nr:LL-diaminopimelate aminotransferase [Oscillospiraceae bacterium]